MIPWRYVHEVHVCRGAWDDGEGWHIVCIDGSGDSVGEEGLDVDDDATPDEALEAAENEYRGDYTIKLVGDLDDE